MASLRLFLVSCSGVPPESARHLPPSEQNWLALLGGVTLFSSGFALLGANHFLQSVFTTSGWLPILCVAVAWGVFIFVINCAMLTAHHGHSGRWASAFVFILRLTIALFLGVVIAAPILLKFFELDINDIILDKNTAHINQIKDSYHRKVDEISQRYEQMRNKSLDLLNQEDRTTGNPYAQLQQNIREAEARKNSFWAQAQCELRGGQECSGKEGDGPLYKRAIAEVNQENSRLQGLRQEEAKNRGKIQEAREARAKKESEILNNINKQTEAELSAAAALRDNQEKRWSGSGALAKVMAILTAAHENRSTAFALLFFAIMFVVVDIAPVLTALLVKNERLIARYTTDSDLHKTFLDAEVAILKNKVTEWQNSQNSHWTTQERWWPSSFANPGGGNSTSAPSQQQAQQMKTGEKALVAFAVGFVTFVAMIFTGDARWAVGLGIGSATLFIFLTAPARGRAGHDNNITATLKTGSAAEST